MSQGSLNVPTGGTISAVTFAGLCNTAWNALTSKNSGASSPANGPGSAPVQFMDWMDTTNAAFPIWKLYDGANFPRIGTLDVSNSTWLPQLGGGVATLSTAGTVNLGNSPQTYLKLTGAGTIINFGATAKAGEMKRLAALSQITFTNSAQIACPGARDLVLNVGDSCWAVHEGIGNWTVFDVQRASAGAAGGMQTGAMFPSYLNATIPGAVRCLGSFTTIGKTGSAATERANDDTLALYRVLWAQTQDPEITVSGGRGATADIDFAAGKVVTTPDCNGRFIAGIDLAGRLGGVAYSPNSATIGGVGGTPTNTLSQANFPAGQTLPSTSLSWAQAPGSSVGITAHCGTGGVTDSNGTHPNALFSGADGGNTQTMRVPTANSAESWTQDGSAPSIGGGISGNVPMGGSSTALSNVPPSKLLIWYICL